MSRRQWIGVSVLVVGVLGALALGASGSRDAEASDWTREDLARLYPSLAPAAYRPPACVAGQERFTDVPASHPFCAWIEEMDRRGITGGCTATAYCPNNPVTRAQMAVFVVKASETCPTMDSTDEMIRVGGVCIDKYEASIWSSPTGGTQYGVSGDDYPCSDNGQDCSGLIFARSVPGVPPSRFISWLQAQQALASSGKRLPTNAQWQMAVAGTPDSTDCNVSSGAVADTGSFAHCVSDWGTFDMVGNVEEWVADWGDHAVDCTHWPATLGDDSSCFGLGNEFNNHFPGAFTRGGYFDSGTDAGPFNGAGSGFLWESHAAIGFRGAR